MIKPEVLDALLAAGATAEMIVAAVKADAEESERLAVDRRAKKAAQKRKERQMSPNVAATSSDIERQVATGSDNLPSDKEKSPTPSKENNSYPLTISPFHSEIVGAPASPPPKKPKPSDLDVLEILETCLTAQTAAELIAHRKAKKAPMTAGAAKALIKSFQAFGDPEAAASAMMANGWQGFNPEWMRNQARAGPPQRPQTVTYATMLAELKGYGKNDETSFDFNGKTIDADPVGDPPGPRFGKIALGN